jgi:hypothetical protein
VGPIGIVGFGALGLLVVLWLVVSFSEPGPRRDVLEWLATTCLYVTLTMLFLNLVLRAHGSGSTLGLVAFGFLGALFGCGCVVSLVQTLRSLRTSSQAQASATN